MSTITLQQIGPDFIAYRGGEVIGSINAKSRWAWFLGRTYEVRMIGADNKTVSLGVVTDFLGKPATQVASELLEAALPPVPATPPQLHPHGWLARHARKAGIVA